MNNITLPVRELKTALTGLSKVISKRATLPVLQHTRIDRAANGATTISATDLDAFASYRFAEGSEGKAESILARSNRSTQSPKVVQVRKPLRLKN